MHLEIIKIHEVWANTDTTEGRGRDVVLARFFAPDAARHYARDKGVMGNAAIVKENEILLTQPISQAAFPVYRPLGKPVPIYVGEEDIIRERAMAKLTPEERKILGLI